MLSLSNLGNITLSAPFINKYISSGFLIPCNTTLIDFLSEEYSNWNGILYVISDKVVEFIGFFIIILLSSFLPKKIYLYFLAKFKMAISSGDDAWYINFFFELNSFSSITALWQVDKAVINKSAISFCFIFEFLLILSLFLFPRSSSFSFIILLSSSSFLEISSSWSLISSIKLFLISSSKLFFSSLTKSPLLISFSFLIFSSLLLISILFSSFWISLSLFKNFITFKSLINSSSLSNDTCRILPYSSLYFCLFFIFISFSLSISFLLLSFSLLIKLILFLISLSPKILFS